MFYHNRRELQEHPSRLRSTLRAIASRRQQRGGGGGGPTTSDDWGQDVGGQGVQDGMGEVSGTSSSTIQDSALTPSQPRPGGSKR